MAAVLLVIVSVALAVSAAWLRVSRGLVVVVAVMLLVPATLSVPNPLTPDVTVAALVIVAFAGGLVWRTATHRLPPTIWRPGPVHALAAIYVVVTFVTGVGLAGDKVQPLTALTGWLDVVNQMVVLVAGIAAFRAIGDDGYVLKVLAAGLLATAAVGIGEHFTGDSWAQLWYSGLRSQRYSLEAADLVRRSGEVRVRGATQFALEYAWICALLFPALIAAAVTAWRRKLLLAPAGAIVLVAIVWSVTRSAIPAVGIGILLLALLVRDGRFFAVLGVSAAVTAMAVIVHPNLTGSLSESIDPGSIAVRGQRLPLLLQVAQQHKVTGVGFGGLNAVGLPTTDSGWLRVYGEIGTLGLVALIMLFVTVLAYVGRGLFAPDVRTRTTCGVVVVALVLVAFAGFVYDTFTVMTTARVIWLLAALGLSSAERLPRHRLVIAGEWRQRTRRAALAGAVGLSIGALAYVAWPKTYAAEARFELFPPAVDIGNYDTVDTGKVLLDSVCSGAGRFSTSAYTVQCRSTEGAAGEGIMRISAASASHVTEGLFKVVAQERALVQNFQVVDQTPPQRGVPAAVADAPLALALLGISGAFLLPFSPPTRRRSVSVPVLGATQGVLQ
jgi:hypothetical protein